MSIFAYLGNQGATEQTQPVAPRVSTVIQQAALQNTDEEDYTNAGSKAGRVALSRGAPYGPELTRILGLSTRDWSTAYDIPTLVETYTQKYRFPNAVEARLLPMQAVALQECVQYRRVYVVAGLGTGKTLLSGLLPTALGFNSDEVAYIPPKKLVDTCQRELSRLYIDGWRVCVPKHIISAEAFSGREGDNWLDLHRPKCIVLDESQTFANPTSGRSKKIRWYLEANPGTYVIPMTATPGDTSLKSVQHLMQWSLGEEHMPVPADKSEFWIWCQCLDADTGFDQKTKKQRRRPPPGELVRFLPDSSEPTLDNVRNAVGKRIESTPGVFYYRIDDLPTTLSIAQLKYDGHSRTLRDEFAAARAGDELADGRVLDVPVADSVLFATLGLGFARIIDPPPPQEWRDCRKEYNSLIREILEDESLGLATPGQVALKFAKGEFTDTGAYARWRDMRPTFEVHKRTVWLDEGALNFVADWSWLHEADGGIIWCEYPGFARKLSAMTGLPFFWQQGLSADGKSLDTYRPGEDGPRTIIASIKANATGRNLQRWHRNLVIGCPAKADLLQQLIGRTHRRGQSSEHVTVDILLTSVENALALYKAKDRAQVDRTIGRAIMSRLLDCSWGVSPLADIIVPGDPIWSSRRSVLLDSDEHE